MTFSSSKQRTTWAIASVSRMLARNLLPRPSPLEAPSTRPAMSTNSMVVGRIRSGLTMSARACRRGSGIGTIPLFGSMVQKGKFSAAIPDLVSALNRVDLPTLGRPTMPQLNPMVSCLGTGWQRMRYRRCQTALNGFVMRCSASFPLSRCLVLRSRVEFDQAFWLCRRCIARVQSPARISGSTSNVKSMLASSFSRSAWGARPNT